MPAAVAACGLLAVGVVSNESQAAALPPSNSCAAEPFGLLCDGQIGPDNTFMRCRISRGMLGARGLYLPATEKCWVVDLNVADPSYGDALPRQHL